MGSQTGIPDFFVYGEPSRELDVGFLHVERVQDRGSLHGGEVQLHRHAEMGQITFWTEGRGVYRIEDGSMPFVAPAVSFVPSGVAHGFTVEQGSDAVVVSVANSTLATIGETTLLPLSAPVFVCGEHGKPEWPRLRRITDLIEEEYRHGWRVHDRVLPSLVSVAFSFLARLDQNSPGAISSATLRLATALRGTIESHFRENWKVARFVDHLATTPYLLDQASRAVLGASVREAVLSRRLLEAKRLLMFTIRPVEIVAYEVGFADAAYFSRFFKARCGLAPSEWRRSRAQHPKAASAVLDARRLAPGSDRCPR